MTTLQNYALFITLVAGVITSLGIIWSKFLGRFIARPMARAIRKEFEEAVEQIVVQTIGLLPKYIGEAQARISKLEHDVNALWKRLRKEHES